MAEAGNGWKVIGTPPYGANGVHVRYGRDSSGRWVVTDLFIHGSELTNETLRGISLARYEARQNRPGAGDPGDADDSDLTVGELRRRGRTIEEKEREERQAGVVRAFLRRPDGSDPEQFYRNVAAAYGQYRAETNAPARAIADEAGVPVTTAHRWIREARRRGYLPPGRKGRAG